jgi:hypothetical protein
MGLLDDLKAQAERRKYEDAEKRRQAAALEAAYVERIHPVMQRIFGYLSELVENINYLKPETLVHFAIREFDCFDDLRQQDYLLSTDSLDRMQQIQLRFTCVGQRPLNFAVTPTSVASDLRELLMDHGLTFRTMDYYDEYHNSIGGRFEVEPRVPGRVVVEADIPHTLVRLTLINFDSPSLHRAHYLPEEVASRFLDNLGSYILRKNQHLTRLFLPEETRKAIRIRLEEERDQGGGAALSPQHPPHLPGKLQPPKKSR